MSKSFDSYYQKSTDSTPKSTAWDTLEQFDYLTDTHASNLDSLDYITGGETQEMLYQDEAPQPINKPNSSPKTTKTKEEAQKAVEAAFAKANALLDSIDDAISQQST